MSAAELPLEAAARWAPHSAPAMNNLAVLRMRQSRFDQALALCEQALVAQPDYMRAHRTAARAALRGGDVAALRRHGGLWLKVAGDHQRWLDSLARQAPDPTMANEVKRLRQGR